MKFLYYLVLKPLSLLPSGLLHLISDLLAFLLRSVFGYRKDLVRKNMGLCFPDKDEKWIAAQSKAFYSNLADVIVESIQGFSFKAGKGHERIQVINPEVLQSSFDKGRSVILTGGHYASWEAMTLAPDQIPHQVFALYKPLKNTFMDGKVKSSREAHGTHMISIKGFRPYFEDRSQGPRLFVFGIDQSPRKGKGSWIDFLGRDTLVFTGPERLSKEYDMDVVAGRMSRVARGKYELRLELLFNDPRSTAEEEITIATNKDLEAQIKERPSDWLWSHNRWKNSQRDGA